MIPHAKHRFPAAPRVLARIRFCAATWEAIGSWLQRAPEICGVTLSLFVATQACGAAEAAGAGFDLGNKLYEQGKYREAAAAYETVAKSGLRSEALYFNLGNAWFKAGQVGRAIAAWRQAEYLSPRDPSIRFNLQFARKQVTGSETPAGLGSRVLRALTLNEWSILVSIALWLWFLLLALREFRPTLKPALAGYTASAGVVLLALGVGLGAAIQLQLGTVEAVAITPETLARSGPLEEAKVLHRFRDGTELTVLDRKETAGDARQSWLQARDSSGRTGWIRADNVIVLAPLAGNAVADATAGEKANEPPSPTRQRLLPTPIIPDSNAREPQKK